MKFALEKMGEGVFPETAGAIIESTKVIQQQWIGEALQAFKHPTGGYLNAIQIVPSKDTNPYHGRVVINDLPYAEHLENGYPAYDMKKMLFTSHQVRMNKDGKRYMIIPFKHGTPAHQSEAGSAGNRATMRSMPQHIYDPAQKLLMSQIKSKFAENSVQDGNREPGRGYVAKRRNYEWGGRLSKKALESVGASEAEIERYSGMVRLPREEQQSTGSQYLTFRVMTEDSKGWIHPAQPPLKIAEKAEHKSAPIVRAIIEKAFERDIETLYNKIN